MENAKKVVAIHELPLLFYVKSNKNRYKKAISATF
jgi:hypothetical protein